METPNDRKYARTHEWVLPAQDGTARIGITDHAQHELGDVVYLDLPAAGRTLVAEDAFGSVESVKAISDLVAPVSGGVVAVNEDLAAAPEAVNTDPYGSWMIQVRMADPTELERLLDAAAYDAFAEAE